MKGMRSEMDKFDEARMVKNPLAEIPMCKSSVRE